jgi:hypothetical protein
LATLAPSNAFGQKVTFGIIDSLAWLPVVAHAVQVYSEIAPVNDAVFVKNQVFVAVSVYVSGSFLHKIRMQANPDTYLQSDNRTIAHDI